jgi:hypothetical protein
MRPAVKKVDFPRTLLDNTTNAHSEFYEVCCKASIAAGMEQLDKYLAQMPSALETARKRMSG